MEEEEEEEEAEEEEEEEAEVTWVEVDGCCGQAAAAARFKAKQRTYTASYVPWQPRLATRIS